jgi:hypothetical protein
MSPATVEHDHPKQRLLFFVAQDVDGGIRQNVRDFVNQLALRRDWLNGAPRFVNSRAQPEDASGGDMPVETVGGYIDIYSALPPWTLPREVDIQHLDEVTDLVNALCDFSRQHRLVFELELDGTFVGAITDGEVDRLIAEGLLGEWRRQLGMPT